DGRATARERIEESGHLALVGDVHPLVLHNDSASPKAVDRSLGLHRTGTTPAEHDDPGRTSVRQPAEQLQAESTKSARDDVGRLRSKSQLSRERIAWHGVIHRDHDLPDMLGRSHEAKRLPHLRFREDLHWQW